MRKDRHVANLLATLASVTFDDFFINHNFYIDTPSYPFIPYESSKFHRKLTKLCLVFGVCFLSIPPIYGFAGLEFPFMMFFFPNYYIFPYIFPPKSPLQPHHHPTTNHHQPPPTTIPHHPYHHHSTHHADGAEQLGRTLRFVEISVAGRHGQRVRGLAGKQQFCGGISLLWLTYPA